MTLAELQKINDERLACWKRRLEEEHATPIVLIGVGHDHNSGQFVLCLLEDGPFSHDATVAQVLRALAEELEGHS